MGIPRFYRWLSERYPRINQRIGENVELLPEVTNMYLDANGIIHTCSHPNDEDVTSVQLTMEEMAINMMGYIDRMVQIIRPKKVLYIAVDGCAPRAKMNQQRSRRFASARDSAISTQRAIDAGELTKEEAANRFDSNVITPGTPFMAELSKHFEFFIRKKIREDPTWANLQVIYSAHDVPGEGEHKIMDYIRRVRAEPGYDPNTSHCLCGLDADLMMLGLATHEPHFSLLREEVDFSNPVDKQKKKNATKEVKEQISKDKWELLRISTWREYISLEYNSLKAKFAQLDLERVIDDWVVMVMFVGNDFLPCIPTMDIFEGALDTLIEIHKEMLPVWKGHLTKDDGSINWERMESLLKRLAENEESVFKKRDEERAIAQSKNRRGRAEIEVSSVSSEEGLDADDVEGLVDENDDVFSAQDKIQARKRRNAYYSEKFGISPDDPNAEQQIRNIVKKYIEGIDWVFNYYYHGVPSWTWFYPFHFAPLASDLKNLKDIVSNIKHNIGEPFKPFSQLLGCLPASSAHCLPKPYQDLMRDKSSPLLAFYPTEWEIDSNGKRNSWEYVNLLPFIDEVKLAQAVATIEPTNLTAEELARNNFGITYVYRKDLSNTSRLPSTIKSLPAIDSCQSSKAPFRYSVDGIRHTPNLLPGYRLLPGDSSLTTHPDLNPKSCRLDLIKLNIFGTQSRKQTFVLRFHPGLYPETSEGSKQLIESLCEEGRSVWINYPHLHEAIISQVMDIYGNHYDAASRRWREMTLEEKRGYDHQTRVATDKALSGDKQPGTGGISLDRIHLIVRVRPLNGMREDSETGLLVRSFATAEDETWIPFQLILTENPLADPRFVDAPALPLATRFPKETKVVCVAEKGYGMIGTVVDASDETKRVTVRFPARAQKQNEFGHTVANTLQDKYFPLITVARLVGLSPLVADKFLGSLKVSGIHPKDRGKPVLADFGLNLRVGKSHVIPGYARSKAPEAVAPAWSSGETIVRVIGGGRATPEEDTRNLASDTFEYSQRAIDLLRRYKDKFPKIFDKVSRKANSQELDKSDLFNSNKDSKDEHERVLTWLRQIPTFGMPLVPVSSRFMSRDAVIAIENAADEYVKVEQNCPNPPETEITLPPHVLIKPSPQSRGWIESPTGSFNPSLGDRVCNLGNPAIPFGLKGTVVAVHPLTSTVQVVFDTSFVGGSSLSSLCRPGHGALVQNVSLLNLSKKNPIPLEGPIRRDTPVSAAVPSRKKTASQTVTREKTPAKSVTPVQKQQQQFRTAAMDVSVVAKTPIHVYSNVPVTGAPAPVLAPAPIPTSTPSKTSDDVDDLARYFIQLMAAKSGVHASTAASEPVITKPISEPATKNQYIEPQVSYTVAGAASQSANRHVVQPSIPTSFVSVQQPISQPQVYNPTASFYPPQGMPYYPGSIPMQYPQPQQVPVIQAPALLTPMMEQRPKVNDSTSALLDNMFERAHKTENRKFDKL